MPAATRLYICWTTTTKKEEAQTLAQEAVRSGLATCAQIDGPIKSVYRWQGKVHSDPEFRIVFKTLASQLEALENFIEKRHPYDTPEWVCVKAEKVSEKYLKWAEEESNFSGFP